MREGFISARRREHVEEDDDCETGVLMVAICGGGGAGKTVSNFSFILKETFTHG